MEREIRIVVIFEGNTVYIKQFSEELKSHFREGVEIIVASNLNDAELIVRRIIDATLSPDIILSDAFLSDVDRPDTLNLISDIRGSFEGPILAISSFDNYNEELLACGADSKCYKTRAIVEAVSILRPEGKARNKKIFDVNLSEYSLRFLYSCLSGFNDNSRKELHKIKKIAQKSNNAKLKEAVKFVEDNWDSAVKLRPPSLKYSKLMFEIRERLLKSF